MQLVSKELVWNLADIKEKTIVQRHCSNCGRVVSFFDTTIRRHNANGKNIYRYAIFKCEKNHTWNRKLESYKTYPNHVRLVEERQIADIEILTYSIGEYKKSGIREITIKIKQVSGTFRLDKTISERFTDWSRSEVVKKIKEGTIVLNGKIVKPSSKIAENSFITISL